MNMNFPIFLFIGLAFGRPDPTIDLSEDRLDNPDERGGLFQGDMVIDFDPNKRNAIRTNIWPNGRIPYQFDPRHESQFTAADKSRIQQAINDYTKHTCLQWVRKTSRDAAYVNIIRGGGCYSSVGRTGRKQDLSLGRGCTGKGTVIHEMMHAAGFHHEQCRTDRDNYVSIRYENIEAGKEFNFQKYTVRQIQDLGVSYDYGSVMHYSSHAFSKNGRETIVPRQSGATIGNRAGFSNKDISKLNKLYKCSGTVVTRSPVVTQKPVVGGCQDTHTNCAYWAGNGECAKTPGYMLVNCKKSCNQCTTGGCQDTHTNCAYWAGIGECAKNPGYMLVNCKKSCNQCTTVTCTDLDGRCSGWASNGECQKNPGYMLVNCKRSCNVC